MLQVSRHLGSSVLSHIFISGDLSPQLKQIDILPHAFKLFVLKTSTFFVGNRNELYATVVCMRNSHWARSKNKITVWKRTLLSIAQLTLTFAEKNSRRPSTAQKKAYANLDLSWWLFWRSFFYSFLKKTDVYRAENFCHLVKYVRITKSCYFSKIFMC